MLDIPFQCFCLTLVIFVLIENLFIFFVCVCLATEPSIETSNPVQSSRQEEIMKETLSFQGFNKIYIDCAFLQQKIRKGIYFTCAYSSFLYTYCAYLYPV